MKVILMQDVKSLGKKGELVEASDGYARNFLLPRKLAKEAIEALKTAWRRLYQNNTENVVVLNEGLEFQEASNTSVEMQLNENKTLEGKTFKMTAKAGQGGRLFGSVTSKQVAEEIKKQYNIDVDKRKVVLDCDIKEFGTYHAEVKLFTGVSAKIDVQVSEA